MSGDMIARAVCHSCPWETASTVDQMAVIDKLAEKHSKTEGHSVSSGMRRVDA